MPKLPILSGSAVVKALEQLGFHRRGDAGCVVPLHNEVKTGTLAGILRQAQLTRDAFLAATKYKG